MCQLVRFPNGMSSKARLFVLLTLSVLASSSTWTSQLTGENEPSSAALATFEAIHSAEESGANIGAMVSQYNSLLQGSASDDAFNAIKSEAIEAQQSALVARSFDNQLTIVLAPVIAFIISFVTTGSLRFRKKLAMERVLDREIRTA